MGGEQQAETQAILAIEAKEKASQILERVESVIEGFKARTEAAARQVEGDFETLATKQKAHLDKVVAAGGLTAQEAEAVMAKQTAANEAAQAAAAKTAATQAHMSAATTAAAKGTVLALAAVGVGAALLGKDSVETAASFEQSMNRVGMSAGMPKDQMDQLNAAVLQLATNGTYGPNQLADAMYYAVPIIQRLNGGVLDAAHATQFMSGAEDIAIAGHENLNQATQDLSNIMGAYNMKLSDTSKVTDILTNAMLSSNTEIPILGENLKEVGPIAHSLNIPLQDTVAALGELAQAGIKEEGGTRLNEMLNRLVKPAASAQAALDALGVKVDDSQGHFVGLGNILDQFHAKFDGMTDAEVKANPILSTHAKEVQSAAKNYEKYQADVTKINGAIDAENKRWAAATAAHKQTAVATLDHQKKLAALNAQMTAAKTGLQANNTILQQYGVTAQSAGKITGSLTDAAKAYALATIFGMRSESAAKILIDQGGQALDKYSASLAKAGAAHESAERQEQSFEATMQKLHSTIQVMEISIGTALIPVLTTMAQAIAPVITAIGAWSAKHQALTAAIVAGIAVFGILGAAALAVGLAVSVVSAGFVAGAAAVVGIVTVLGALAMALAQNKAVATTAGAVFSAFGATVRNASVVVGELLSGLGNVVGGFIGMQTGVTSTGMAVAALGQKFVNFKNLAVNAFDALAAFFRQWWPVLLIIFTGGLAIIYGQIIAHWSQITGAFKAGAAAVTGVARALWAALTAANTAFNNAAEALWKGLWSALQATVGAAASAIGSAVQALLDHFIAIISGGRVPATGATQQVLAAIGNAIKGYVGQMVAIGGQLIQGLVQGIEGMAGAVGAAVSRIISGIPDAARKLLGIASPSKVFHKIGKHTMKGLADGINDDSEVTAAVTKAMATLKQVGSQRASDAGAKMLDAMNKQMEALKKQVKGHLDATGKEAEKSLTALMSKASKTAASMRKQVTDEVKQLSENAQQQIDLLRGQLADKIDQMKADAVGKSQAMKDQVAAQIVALKEASDAQIKQLQDTTKQRIDDLKNGVTDKFTQMQQQGNSLISTLQSRGQTAMQNLQQGGTASAVALSTATVANLDTMRGQAEGVMIHFRDDLLNIYGQLKVDAYHAGLAIGDGLKQGIDDRINQIKDAAVAAAEQAIAAAKAALGVHSPSTVFHDIGQNIAQGLVNGIASGHADVAAAMPRLATAPAGLTSQRQANLVGPAALTAGGGGATVVNLTLDIKGNTFTGGRQDLDYLANQVEDKIFRKLKATGKVRS